MANYDSIRLEKGLYASGSFNRALESIDPSEDYIGSPLEGLDAYQRQLKRFDIRVNGSGDCIEKFFRTSDSAALFPEFVSRAVRQGMEEANLLPEIVAGTTLIDSLDYRTIASVPGRDNKALRDVAEGSHIPETVIKTQENLVRLRKRGRMLTASYEAIRFQRLDLFAITLRQIGAFIARAQLADAADVLINGDGNSNPAQNTAIAGGSLAYSDLVNLWNDLAPYGFNTLICSGADAVKLVNMDEFKDSAAGQVFHATGKMITPVGARLLRCSDLDEGTLIGLDKSCALEMVKAGEVTTEYDKLIDRQLERAAISCTAGFAKINDGAAKILSL